jgi:PTS system ascorbate-specific IIC component
MQTVLNFIIDNFFKNTPILMALIVALGLVLTKKKWDEVLKGAFLAAIGMTIINLSVNVLLEAVVPDSALTGISTDTSASSTSDAVFLESYGGNVGVAMFIAMILHILIARFTKIKTVFLTGHMLFWFPFLFVAAGVEAGLHGVPLIASAAVFSAVYWSVMPWMLRKFVFAVIGDNSFTLGHPSGILALIAGTVARRVGNKKKSTEDLVLSKRLSFFREIAITGGGVIFILYLIVGFAYREGLVQMGENIFFYALNKGLVFGAGLTFLLLGVRMLIGQIVPAFAGISSKVVKGALPAYDAPILFNYRPNAAIIGFLVALVVSSVVLIACNVFHVFGAITLIPLIVTCFFECGAAAVIAEGQGGLRGAIIGTAVASVVMVGLVGISAVLFSNTVQYWMLLSGGNDFSLFGSIAVFIDKLIATLL